MKILICDDDESSLLLHKTVTRRLMPDAIIDGCSNGRTALKEMYNAKVRYDLVITDFDMPFVNGVDLVKEARAYGMKFICICITGDDISKHKDEFDFVLSKPVRKEELRKTIVNLILKNR